MKASYKDGLLTIVIECNETGVDSASGKTMVHASTRGNVPVGVTFNGQALIIGLNAYTRK